MIDFKNLSYDEILEERAKILINAQYDTDWQEALKAMCKTDPVFFFNFFAFTKDPNKKPANLPFILYPYQKTLIKWLETRLEKQADGLIEKSRQMGITWLMMTWLLYHWLFTENFIALVGSRKEELVDKRDKDDTLFYKLDYNLNRLPKWILPKNFNSVKDRRHLLFINPENNASIVGESSNKDFGRGGTYNCVFLDEFTTWPEASASWDGCSEASSVKIPVSTPKPATFFKTLRFSDQMKGKVKTVYWREHPSKDDNWYQKQKENKSAETLAQEVDISYDVTGRGKVYQEFDSVEIGNFQYNPKLPLYTASDFGLKDPTSILWAQQDKDGNVYIIDSYENSDRTIDFYIPFYSGKIKLADKYKYTNKELKQISEHKKWKRARHFGDPAGKQRNQVTDTSVLKILSQDGIHMFTNDKASSFAPRREATKIMMRRLYVDEKQGHFIECIQQSRYPQRKEGSQATSAISRPIHDWTCLAGNTKIRTLKGWIPIKNLVKEKEIWLWAYSFDEHRLVPVLAHSARKTGKNVPLLEIGLDNGNSMKCTPEHKFMMRNETWKRADELKIDDSLMPFYEQNNSGYPRIDLNNGTFGEEHKIVYYRLKGIPPLDWHIDHIDGNKTNNYPDNLQALSSADHCSKTKEISKIVAKNFEERHKHPCEICGKPCSRQAKRCRECVYKKNHRVRYIKKIDSEDVYDLTVPKYHNFVAEGVVVHNSHFRSALEYLAVNLRLKGAKPKKVNYLKNNPQLDEDGRLSEKQERKEKKRKIIRYSFRSYQ